VPTSTIPQFFYKPDALPAAQPTVTFTYLLQTMFAAFKQTKGKDEGHHASSGEGTMLIYLPKP